MTIYSRVYGALIELGLPVGHGTLLTEGGAELPDEYLVYQLISGVPEQHADDEEKERSYRIQVSYYSRDGLADLPDVNGAMKAIGGAKSAERDLQRDPDTGHFGLAVDYIFQATEEPEGS